MPNRRLNADHQEAVSRRLALLSAELAGARPVEPGVVADPAADDWTEGHTRIRPVGAPPRPVSLADAPEPVEVSDEELAEAPHGPVPELRAPGRHAARRAVRGLGESLRGRIVLGPSQVAVLAIGVALALAVTCWWLVRGGSEQVRAPALDPAAVTAGSPLVGASPVAAGSSSGASEAASTGEASVTVDVAGKVHHRGIVVLDAGARVIDAIEAAGGARRGVDLTALNLARVLVDGEQIVVGQARTAGTSAGVTASATGTSGPLVNLNLASATELEALPEVGPVTAAAIVSWREENGGFTSVDELLEVTGIGDATLTRITPYVTV